MSTKANESKSAPDPLPSPSEDSDSWPRKPARPITDEESDAHAAEIVRAFKEGLATRGY